MHKIWIKHRKIVTKRDMNYIKIKDKKRLMDGPSPNRKRLFELL